MSVCGVGGSWEEVVCGVGDCTPTVGSRGREEEEDAMKLGGVAEDGDIMVRVAIVLDTEVKSA